MNSKSQRGVALVITLILLSIITVLAVAFLATSRRDRASVTAAQSQTDSRLMADTALARVQSEIAARMMAQSNLLSYDFMVSRTYVNTNGFDTSQTPTDTVLTNVAQNVNYERTRSGGQLTRDEQILNIANLFYDPRVPVFLPLTQNSGSNTDFRFYLDFNRNGRFDTNGFFQVGTNLVYRDGDPEWIGVLERPDALHSPTNRFVGRYAYLVLPAGKTLDLNYIHNYARGNPPYSTASFNPSMPVDGFVRNQGVGSWELNLAAFFRELNTNVWFQSSYDPDITAGNNPNSTENFTNALSILRYRYRTNANSLLSAAQSFSAPNALSEISTDQIDTYANGPLYTNRLSFDNDIPTQPWAGSDNTNRHIYAVDELFEANKFGTNIPYNIKGGFRGTLSNANVFDTATYYRLLSQLGTDSGAELEGKIHLNYANATNGQLNLGFTNFISWTPLDFFTNAASRIVENHLTRGVTNGQAFATFDGYFVPTNFGIANIPLYPTNYYTPAIHRLLQVTANIYDATTNRPSLGAGLTNGAPYLPSIFRPIFLKDADGVRVVGYTTNSSISSLADNWVSVDTFWNDGRFKANVRYNDPAVPANRVNIFGQPSVVGAKKGWPNFNEFALQSVVYAERKLEIRRPAPNRLPTETNQMLIMGISNVFGLEAWNSYTQNFARPLRVRVFGQAVLTLTNEATTFPLATNLISYSNEIVFPVIPAPTWQANEFKIPLFTNVVLLTNSIYTENAPLSRKFRPLVDPITGKVLYERSQGGVVGGMPVHQFGMTLTNHVFYALMDGTNLVDVASFGNMTSLIDISGSLSGLSNEFGTGVSPGRFWLTNRVNNSGSLTAAPMGVSNQMWVATHGDANARFSYNTYSNQIWSFSNFVYNPAYTNKGTAAESPYNPARRMHKLRSWQVNDPLVHYMLSDIEDFASRTNNIAQPFTTTNAPSMRQLTLGIPNDFYQPWDGNPYKSQAGDPNANNITVKDPLVYRSDDWDFPTNKFGSIGWLGRVHRGTPWQTVYLKAAIADTNTWKMWARSSVGSHPTNDWRLLDLFTAVPNENAAHGLLSVNQSGSAAWAAVLGDVMTLSNATPNGAGLSRFTIPQYAPIFIQAGSTQLTMIVKSINAARDRLPGRVFTSIGDVFAADALTTASPYLNLSTPSLRNYTAGDAVYERIPQQIASLLQLGKPRFAVYCFGQALKPAEKSILSSAPNARLVNLCTNYQITGEVVTRTVLRVEGTPNNPKSVIENFQVLFGE